MELIRKLKLDELLESVMPSGREDIPWSRMAIVLAISRLCSPSSELHIAEHYYAKTAMPELLGISSEKVYDERLRRALDKLPPHKETTPRSLFEKLSLGDGRVGLGNPQTDLARRARWGSLLGSACKVSRAGCFK